MAFSDKSINQFLNLFRLIPIHSDTDADIADSATSSKQSSSEEASSTEPNDTVDNLNRRINIDNHPSTNSYGCNDAIVSRTENLPNTHRQQFNNNNLNFQRQLSQLRRANIGKSMRQHEINGIPLRRLPYQPHQKRKNI